MPVSTLNGELAEYENGYENEYENAAEAGFNSVPTVPQDVEKP